MERWRKEWCAVNREFSENWKVVRWRAVGAEMEQAKSQKRLLLGRECDSGCELRNLHAELG